MKTERARIVMFIVAVVALVASFACASAQGKLVLAEDAVHDALARVDDQVRTVCAGPDAMRLKPACTDVRSALIPTMEAGAAFNRAVDAQKVSALVPLVEAVGKLTSELKKLPQGQVGTLVVELARAVSSAYQEVK